MENKNENDFFKNIKYVPKHTTTLLFFLLFGLASVLFSGRKSDFLRPEFILELMPGFYGHISNFSLSYMLYAGIGYFWLMMGIKFRYIVFLGITILASNFIYELYIPILNTPDIIDAFFGVAGTILGFLFLFYVQKFGLRAYPGKTS